MEPLTFILGIASGVITGVLTDLITGKTKAARKAEIEKEVSQMLLEQAKKQHLENIKLIKRQVLDEIDILAARHPDLIVSSDTIELRNPPKIGLFNKRSATNEELKQRLNQLDEIVEQRRKSLGLPTVVDEVNVGQPESVKPKTEYTGLLSESATSIEWGKTEEFDTGNQPSKWALEIEEMDRRISARRKGKKIEDMDEKRDMDS